MTDHHEQKTPVKKVNPFVWFLWWQMDQSKLEKQVKEYDTLKFAQSARGISAILLWISVAATAVLVVFFGLEQWAFIDAAILLVLGFFVAKGYRWALIVAMLLWTFEKGLSLYDQLLGASATGGSFVVMTIIWWTLYMHSFYLAFKVEQMRKKPVSN